MTISISSVDQLFFNYFHTIGCPMVKEKPLPHHPFGRKAKMLDYRHQGGTHCRCDYCTTPYNRAQFKRSADAEISAYYQEPV